MVAVNLSWGAAMVKPTRDIITPNTESKEMSKELECAKEIISEVIIGFAVCFCIAVFFAASVAGCHITQKHSVTIDNSQGYWEIKMERGDQ